jgi:hypothetical protein
MNTSYHIQEFRCRISPDALVGEYIAYLTFPYHRAFNTFLERVKAIRGEKLKRRDMPPFESLNRLLVSLTPSLVHPFIPYYLDEEGVEEKVVLRRMMVLSKSPRPSLAQIERVIHVWIRQWAEYCFKKELRTSDGADAYTQLLAQLSSPETDWEEVEASGLIRDIQNPLAYRAIPSLLAALLAGQRSEILGEDIAWQLTQEPKSNRLALVSQPLYSSYYFDWKDKTVTGYFAYHVEFGMQTVPGDARPFVHVSISCRRYVEAPVKELLFPRKSTVMVGTLTPRLEDWPVEPTLVPIRIRGVKKRTWWEDRVTELLYDLRARPLTDIQEIVSNPKSYWEPDDVTGDRYFLLQAEGIRPNHPLETGFSPRELYAVWQSILVLCHGILQSEAPLDRDSRTQRIEKTASMLPVWELSERARVPVFVNGQKKWQALSSDVKQQFGSAALQRALSGQPLTVLLLYRTKQTYDAVIKQLQLCALWQCPEITVRALRLDDHLTTPLEHGTMDPDMFMRPGLTKEEREALEDQWEQVVEAGRRKRVKEWRTFLTPLLPTKGAIVALIELPPESVERDDLNPRRAIREACVRERIGSQMLVSVTDGTTADQSRVKSALADLLVRQLGVLYGNVTDMYHLAGLPADMASRLTVVGLCRVRNREHGLDYAVAVRVLPDGRIEMLLPEDSERWRPYREGCLALGEIFRNAPPSKDRRHKRDLKLGEEVIRRFIQRACLKAEGPTVVLIGAHDFRGVWKQLQNPHMLFNELSFAKTDLLLRPDLLPDLWILRLRETGPLRETPQYVRLLEGALADDEEAHYAEGLYDAGLSGPFPIYHSIGRGPTSGKQSRTDLKIERGGTTAFKHQHVLETIPFFLHDASVALPLARMTYFFRFTPAWEVGTTTFPFPNHLGYDAIDDYLCLLPSMGEDEDL